MDSEDKYTGIEIGKAYVFWWIDKELTGIATRITGRQRWVTIRTGRNSFSVPPQDVLREAGDQDPK